MSEKEIYKIANRRANVKLGFYIHLTVFMTVNLLMLSINLLTTPNFFWAAFPFLGWGIGLALHGLGIFVFGDAKNKLVANEINRLQPAETETVFREGYSEIPLNSAYQPGGWMK